ncbi:MAG TPA: MFS transporter, partial [Acetobacteraceae bacterium]|nr:MFS transporter [Acetobacteraceae bacterium]
THGKEAKAAESVGEIEERMARHAGTLPPLAHAPIRLVAHDGGWFAATFRLLLGFVLMASQIFYYNVIFFTYLIILTQFYHVPAGAVGWFLLPFAAGNFLGPLLLGRLFDTLGRRTMIGGTYALGAALMLVAAGFMLWLGVAAAGGGGAAAFRGGAAGMSGLV